MLGMNTGLKFGLDPKTLNGTPYFAPLVCLFRPVEELMVAAHRCHQCVQRAVLELPPHESGQRRTSQFVGLAGLQGRLQGRAGAGCDEADDQVDGGGWGDERLWPCHVSVDSSIAW